MSSARLSLPQVTLCAVTSVNVLATVRALEASLDQVDFAACKLLTSEIGVVARPGIEIVRIPKLNSSMAYSEFILSDLPRYVDTSHCMISQWDGHVLNASAWRQEFLDHDFIGASWPQFADGHDVGNGGFSLRTRRLMDLCLAPGFVRSHPEDIAIGRTNRSWLESQGIRFAPRELADLFAAERRGDPRACFGYHGVWHMPRAIGVENFWHIYRELDERSTFKRDFASLTRDVRRSPGGYRRVGRMLLDRMHVKIK